MKTLIVIDSVGVEDSFVEKLKKFLCIKYSKSIEENYKWIAITINTRQVCNSTSLEGLIGFHILWLLLGTELVNRAEIFERPGRCIRKCFDHKEGQTPLLAKEGSNRCCTSHFVVSLSLSLSPLPSVFYDSFLFIVEPESLVHNGPVRGMRASNRCSSHPLGPSIRVWFFLPFLPSRDERRENQVSTAGERRMRDEKSTLPPPLFFVKSFFWLTVTPRWDVYPSTN